MFFPIPDTSRTAALTVLYPFHLFAAEFSKDRSAAVIRQPQYVRPTEVFVDPGEARIFIVPREPASIFVRVVSMAVAVRVGTGGMTAVACFGIGGMTAVVCVGIGSVPAVVFQFIPMVGLPCTNPILVRNI